jgi:SAM-dependent methyltransferase
MERLARAAELLDGPLDDPGALAGNLRDLRRVNRWLGGIAVSAAAIGSLATHRDELSLLDVGTGGADIPIALARGAARRGRRLRVVGLDSRAEVLDCAASGVAASGWQAAVELQLGDGLALPYPDGAFDIVHASLVTHHLEPRQVVDLFVEMGRVARLGIVVNDLVRSRPAWLAAWLLTRLTTRNRYTRHDAPLSVRRAYRTSELVALLAGAGLRPARIVRGLAGHRIAIAAVRAPKPEGPVPAATARPRHGS